MGTPKAYSRRGPEHIVGGGWVSLESVAYSVPAVSRSSAVAPFAVMYVSVFQTFISDTSPDVEIEF